MIEIENTSVFGWEAAIRGMRSAMNSWAQSDSEMCRKCLNTILPGAECPIYEDDEKIDTCYYDGCYLIGDNDLKLMRSLVKAGTDHSKFMRMINVTCDIVAPLYWWKEACTYRIGVTMNSCSTMHKIHAKEFTLDDFSHEHLMDSGLCLLANTISLLNFWRLTYIEMTYPKTRKPAHIPAKECWWQMIQLLPSSYNQRRTVQLNYQVLRNIYHARRNHKLDEWHTFCEWIETLPYFKDLCIGKEE